MKVKTFAKNAQVEKQDNSIMENTLNWLVNGVDMEARRIECRGAVSPEMASYITRNLLKMSQISEEPIELYFSSPGGEVHSGMAIYDAIVACPAPVHIIASGEIMSMGFIIFLAGDKRVAAKHTRFMMHSISYGIEGITKDHEVQVNEAKTINNALLEIMGKRTKRDKKFWYRSVLSHDKYMGTEEAIQLGVVNTQALPEKKKPVKKVVKKDTRKTRTIRG